MEKAGQTMDEAKMATEMDAGEAARIMCIASVIINTVGNMDFSGRDTLNSIQKLVDRPFNSSDGSVLWIAK
jgi:hypothetical protein